MKKKSILVVLKDEIDEGVKQAYDMLDEKKYNVQYRLLDEISMLLTSDETKIFFDMKEEDLLLYSICYFRNLKHNKDVYSSLYMRFPKLKVLQNIKPSNTGNKLIQYSAFAREGLPFPKTIFVKNNDIDWIEELIDTYLFYPVVVKDWQGSRGDNCYLINNQKELEDLLINYPNFRFIIQEYIPNTHDYRILVTGDEVSCVIKRTRKADSGEWRNNTSLGADREVLDVDKFPEDLKDLAIKASKSLDLTIGGADIVVSSEDKKAYLLEMNSSPNFKPGIAESIVKYTIESL